MDVPKDSAARLGAGLHWQTSTGGLVKPRHPGTQTAALIHWGRTGGRAVCLGPQTPGSRQMNSFMHSIQRTKIISTPPIIQFIQQLIW